MFSAETLLAALLLTGPADPDHAVAAVLRPSVLALALDAEVLDPRERGFVMSQDVLGDLAMLQGRWTAFETAPNLWEVERFPDAAHVRRALELNRARRLHLSERRKIDLIHAGELEAEIRRVDQLYQVFDAVRDARADYFYTTVRRDALRLLRELIGERAFAEGRLPLPVP